MPAALSPALRSLLAAPEALIPAVRDDMGNPPWNDAAQRVLIARLSPLEDVVGSSSHLFLFSECRRALGGAFIDFAFLPGRGDRDLLSARGLPFFYGLSSGRAPGDFDLILVSNAFSLELVNLGYLFSPRLPPLASDRRRSPERLPIVILGGSNASACGALLLPGASEESESDCLVDGIFFGEGEAIASPETAASPEAMASEPGRGAAAAPESPAAPGRSALAELVLALAVDPSAPRAARLARASAVRGFWSALSGLGVERTIARPYAEPLVGYPVLNSAEALVARLQISSGCPGLCSFCLEGWDRRPYREVPADRLVAAAREIRELSGAETLEIYSFNFNTHSSILELVFELGRIFKRVNLMSQRLDILSRRPSLLAAELAADKRSFTLGIEGVSRRMRAFYRKGLGEEDIEAAASMLIAPGVRELKLFYMIAGIEGPEDLAELASFAARLAKLRGQRASGTRVLASAGFLVRLPGTPLQYAPLCLDRKRLSELADRMRAICETEGIEFRLAADYDDYFADQLLSLGGSRLAPWLQSASAEGLVYDGGLPRGGARSLESFARKAGLLEGEFLGEKEESWKPPLSFALDGGGALLANYRKAAAGEDRRPCLGIEEGERGSCEGCGACEDGADADRMTGHSILGAGEAGKAASRIARLVEAKRRLAAVIVRVDLPESLARATAEYRASWLSRLAASRAPREFRAVLELRDALFEEGARPGSPASAFGGTLERYWGRTLYALSGPDAALVEAAASKASLERFGGAAPSSRVEVEVRLPASFGAGARTALDAWLEAERVDFIETRTEGGRRLECSARAAKKRLLYGAELLYIPSPRAPSSADPASEEADFVARLALGPKARLSDWLRRLPPGAERMSSVRVVSW